VSIEEDPRKFFPPQLDEDKAMAARDEGYKVFH
jgi:hypothetical protein